MFPGLLTLRFSGPLPVYKWGIFLGGGGPGLEQLGQGLFWSGSSTSPEDPTPESWFSPRPVREGHSVWLGQMRVAQAARMACAVLMASATSALPKVGDPYSDRLRLRLSRSKRLRAGSSTCIAIDSAYCARA